MVVSPKRGLALAAPVLALGLALGLGVKAGTAEAQNHDASFDERCATRLAITFLGTSATEEMLGSKDPQADFVDVFLNDSVFVERFSRFVNSTFNLGDGVLPEHDAVYFAAKHVLSNKKPWADTFVGKFNVQVVEGRGVQVLPDEEGLGYFRSPSWLVRYAGNEPTGIKLTTAYRIMQNVVGLHLVATTNAPEADVSATGRAQSACAGCHYNGWYALDKVAGVLSKRVDGENGAIAFTPYEGPPQTLLDGATIGNDADLVKALVASEDFTFNACRLAFKFLYGRPENACEGPIFDQCVDAFRDQGTIQSALAVVAKNPAFCQ